ncbi:hypothetical protein B0H21DRAFT_856845 [Amylocystis lapponica]|nr:hypothetical protein B0H21DRAFT_856845 [Amylocystis lapponica]
MKGCGAPDVPSFSALRKKQMELAREVHIETKQHVSPQSNVFYANLPSETLKLDFANPLVRPHIQVYPEVGCPVSEFYHGEKWQHVKDDELDLNQLMWADWVNAPHKHFYIKELAELRDGRLIIPLKWLVERDVGESFDGHLVAYNSTTGEFEISDKDVVRVKATELSANYLDLKARGCSFRFPEYASEWTREMPHPVRKIAKDRPTFTLRLMCWSDDVSGNKTKQFNAHHNIYVENINLPHQKLQQEYFVRFCSTSQHASSSEQMEAVFNDTGEDRWHSAYDCHLEQEILFRIIVHVLPADNPQQSEHCSHIGSKGNFSCRRCKAGGTSEVRESNEGYKAMFSPDGTPRTHAGTVKEIQDQLYAAGLGIQDTIEEMQTLTGVKDKLAQYWIDIVIARARALQAVHLSNPITKDERLKDSKLTGEDRKRVKNEIKENIQRECHAWLVKQPPDRYCALPEDSPLRNVTRPGDHFNVLFSRPRTLCPHCDTPCEILHTFSLGGKKYVWHKTTSEWDAKKDEVYAIRLRTSSVDGLLLSPVRSDYILRYKNALVGKHFKILQQVGAFHLHGGICPDLVVDLWKASGELGAMLWYHSISDMEQYLADLEILIANLLDIWAVIDPNRILTKSKLHVLSHLLQDIRRFGPAVLYSTEIFECWNAVFRFCSILSNHQAPSRDIAVTLAGMERFKHQVSGGWWCNTDGQYVRAGENVRTFLHSNPALQRRLGWVDPEHLVAGTVKLESQAKQAPSTWVNAMEFIQVAPPCNLPSLNGQDCEDQRLWYHCRYIVSQSKDICKPGSWVFFQENTEPVVVAGRILKILASANGRDPIVVIEPFDISSERDVFLNMPVLTRHDSNVSLVLPKDILFLFNAQHDCRMTSCSPTGKQHVVQEKTTTARTETIIAHTTAERFLLNMHAIHNAALIRSTLPRYLTKPIPYLQDRHGKHCELAAVLRKTGPVKCAQTVAKAAETRARNKQAKLTKSSNPNPEQPTAASSLGSTDGNVPQIFLQVPISRHDTTSTPPMQNLDTRTSGAGLGRCRWNVAKLSLYPICCAEELAPIVSSSSTSSFSARALPHSNLVVRLYMDLIAVVLVLYFLLVERYRHRHLIVNLGILALHVRIGWKGDCGSVGIQENGRLSAAFDGRIMRGQLTFKNDPPATLRGPLHFCLLQLSGVSMYNTGSVVIGMHIRTSGLSLAH